MIFLSASVPTPQREFYGTENVFAIREAIIAQCVWNMEFISILAVTLQ